MENPERVYLHKGDYNNLNSAVVVFEPYEYWESIEYIRIDLTWTKVKDGLPKLITPNDHMSMQVLCKLGKGGYKICQYSTSLGFYPLFHDEKVTEWKPIS